tara:strand:- start:174 stop:308 length:135 start_codon:yes stop_codon:yes gene_type:complete
MNEEAVETLKAFHRSELEDVVSTTFVYWETSTSPPIRAIQIFII